MEPEWCKVEKLWKNHNFKDYGKSGTFGFSHHDSLNIKAMQRTSNDATRRLVSTASPLVERDGPKEEWQNRIMPSADSLQ